MYVDAVWSSVSMTHSRITSLATQTMASAICIGITADAVMQDATILTTEVRNETQTVLKRGEE